MKKKTLLILLIVALSVLYITLLIRIIDIGRAIESTKSFAKFIGHGITEDDYRTRIIYGIIKPLIELILQLFVAVLFTFLSIKLWKREQLFYTVEERRKIEEKSKEKQEQKKQRRILQLNAKIEKLKNKDDD
jgi:Mg2+/Co2+ transporter CorB